MENINNLINSGYEKLISQSTVEACKYWLQAFDKIKLLAEEKGYKDFEDIEDGFKFIESLTNWAQDLEMELENAGIEDKEFFKKRISYVNEFCRTFSEVDQFIIMNMNLAEAESYFEIGETEKSEELFEKYSKEYKNSTWPSVKWGDIYWLSNILKEKKELINLNKAMEVYKMGLGRDKHEDYILEDRIEDLKGFMER
ncbi:hypothetical protein ACOAKC_09710 [Hathewaya histolytica]|uniref:hypothetical protein n=1 Tax=Hathewaya histolytica TaxID=1498 RepID=UPI003B67FBC5